MAFNAKVDGKEQDRKLFVAGFSKETTIEEELKSYFEKYGEVIDVVIVRDNLYQSRGFGFVTFADSSTIDDIIGKKMDGTTFSMDDGCKMEVKRAWPKAPRRTYPYVCTKVYVKDLPRDNDMMNENELKSYFEYFGNVTQVNLPRDRQTNRVRGFAFIEFEDEDSADKCLVQETHVICKKICKVTRVYHQTYNNQKKLESSSMMNDDGNDWNNYSATYEYPNPREIEPVNGGEEYMDMASINHILQQAFLLGQQSGLEMIAYERHYGAVQSKEIPQGFSYSAMPLQMQSLLPTPISSSQTRNLIHQALGNQYTTPLPPQAPTVAMTAPPPPVAAPSSVNNDETLDRIVQVLNGNGVDAHALLAKLLKENPSTASQQVAPSAANSSRILGQSRQTTPRAPKSNDDDHSRKYRPY